MKSHKLDRSVAVLGVLGGLALLAIAAIIGKGIGISLSLLLPCIGYLIIARLESHQDAVEREAKSDPRKLHWIGTVCILLLVPFFAFSVHAFLYQRPQEYFILVCSFSALIGLQICMLPRKTSRWFVSSILLQIMLLSASLRWGVLSEAPGLVGSDFYHSLLSNYITENGHVIPDTYVISWAADWVSQSVGMYRAFPLMHIMVSEFALLTSLTSYKESLVMSIGFFEIVSLLFVFLIARNIFRDQRIPLLATLLAAVSVPHIFWGIWLIPQSFGVGFFAMLVYLMVKGEKQRKPTVLALFVLVLVAIALAHTVSSFILVLSVFLLSLSSFLGSRLVHAGSSTRASMRIILFTSITVVAYWMFFSDFLSLRVESLFRSFGNIQVLGLSPAGKSYLAYEVDNLGAYLFYGLGIIGFLSSLKKGKLDPIRFGLSGGALLFLVYAFWLTGFTTFLPDRWLVFVFILFVIPTATGTAKLVGIARGRSRSILMLGILCSFTFLMVMNSDVNMDAPLIGTHQTIRQWYLESEMVGAHWATSYSETTVYTDAGMFDYFLTGLRTRMNFIDFQNFTAPQKSVLIIRDYVYERPISMKTFGTYVMIDPRFSGRLDSFSKIYCNGEVAGYSSFGESPS
jgi:hypothetical protein